MQAQEIDILKYNMLEKNLLSAFVLAVHIRFPLIFFSGISLPCALITMGK